MRTLTESDNLRRAGIILLRVILGVGLALVLSMVGLALAWALFIFFGGSTRQTLLLMSMAGAGLGAGAGVFIAWLRTERTAKYLVMATALVVVLAGVGGGWLGYMWGAGREIECCAQPRTAPFTYTAVGAAFAASAAALLAGLLTELTRYRRNAPVRIKN